jgi:hypothetical protein
MAFIQLSIITASPTTIRSGDSLELSYTISGNDHAPLEITYSLDPANNVFFIDPGRGMTKNLMDQLVLDDPPMPVTKVVTIYKELPPPGKSDYRYFDITVSVTDKTTWDKGTCNIEIL